jgi:hypothetical protein
LKGALEFRQDKDGKTISLRETNALVIDYDDISTDCPDNADFLDNRVTTWEGLVKVMTNFSKIPFADKKAAPLFAST